MDRICVAPNRVLFIDDHEGNIAGAREIGIHAELFPWDGGRAALTPILARYSAAAVTVRIGISVDLPALARSSIRPGLPHREELKYVAEHMNPVEIGGFYSLQRRSSFESWAAAVRRTSSLR